MNLCMYICIYLHVHNILPRYQLHLVHKINPQFSHEQSHTPLVLFSFHTTKNNMYGYVYVHICI